MLIHIGIDDTDSPNGMCTTYIGAILYREISKIAEPLDFPRLIRLNPNVPYKTRGNGAVAMSFKIDEEKIKEVKTLVIRYVRELADIDHENTNPGIVFLIGEVPKELEEFSLRALREHVTIEEAEHVARKVNAEVYKFKLGRGIIGGLAAIGYPLEKFTYELLAYRKREYWGTPRRVIKESVFYADKWSYPFTYDNVDPYKRTVLITPHGKDPVLVGIRGIDVGKILQVFEMIKIEEPIEFFQVYKTNQNTDDHLVVKKIKDVKPYDNVVIRGKVAGKYWEKGRHVFFELEDETGKIRVAAFEPTKKFRNYVRKLLPGDEVIIAGGVKEFEGVLTVNLEKFYPVNLVPKVEYEKPRCPKCGGTMKSKGDYLKCKKCGYKMEKILTPVKRPRDLKKKIYEVPPDARKHISRPLVLPGGEDKILEAL
ncbi:tRNA(Ile2) 2-agmatinylcytidine synthetase [Pyrococcus furiosus DSM 3638]|uniref:tRNA(Ile2) 2-agmatinylcytidine synthetase TiaS n=4 Tax=Pyrococcus furiosus TaxID=2261 RepID=A0A5C0XU96_PYRFU|nr:MULTISPECIES: tRNA(Ile2) 2-agmatinylcytidine synthetase TiaS [Pyrococcus]AAL81979.1 putative transcription-associated protein TFIIS [Pyrococcus furiosus DSM 3638]AFN04786.1 transcription-associated protein TFIIS [Pyrococcus furiosus COM1]MDK2869530.1 tRNA(Ile2)-agmatinylcytidine synthase [Pyrococcus sp.]QEK79454.1 tRNA(Ile2) 2-agmatinylcytidine synthetase [Pyrococcus furiosus DSM 3638]